MPSHKTTIGRLSICGFKSFADEVHLDILSGLTGIVGPNGCGKSNVVEALRWAMGETSARALRGGETDDLIFAGTGARPARNLAQVTLHLTGATGLAPSPFQNADDLEISRRAERGSGSDYRINGRAMRARDVQTLFADLASGARSSAIVSQNRVSQLIAAKPEERRLLLEEAAGITGLHARRHDAELKLRQTETNLSRAEDLRIQLEERLGSLEAQTEQARIYRDISTRLRECETRLHVLLHARADHAVWQGEKDLSAARQAMKDAEQTVEKAVIAEFEAKKAAPAAREETDRLRAALERLTVQVETTRVDMERAIAVRIDAQTRVTQADSDLTQAIEELERLKNLTSETEQTLLSTEDEQKTLPQQLEDVHQRISRLTTDLHTAVESLEEKTRQRDAEAIRNESLAQNLDALSRRRSDETALLESLRSDIDHLDRTCPDESALQKARDIAVRSTESADAARHRHTATERALQNAHMERELTQRTLAEAEKRVEDVTHTEQDLKTRLTRTEKSIEENVIAQERARQALLTTEQREKLENTLRDLEEALAETAEKEAEYRRRQDEAGMRWLEARARAEENAQTGQSLARDRNNAKLTRERAAAKEAEAIAALQAAEKNLIPEVDLERARTKIEALAETLSALQNEIGITDNALSNAQKEEDLARTALTDLEAAILRMTGEYEGLEDSLTGTMAQPDAVEQNLHIPENLTRAFASALADGLEASLAPDTVAADRRWKQLAPLTMHYPAGHVPMGDLLSLDSLVDAPPALNRCLSNIYLVEDESRAAVLLPHLLPGQSLVGRSGALWRWDGFIRSANAPDPVALRLETRHRLHALHEKREKAHEELVRSQKTFTQAQQDRQSCEIRQRENRRKCAETERALADARASGAEIENRSILLRTQWQQKRDALEEATRNLHEASVHANETENALAALADTAQLQEAALACERNADATRRALSETTTLQQQLRSRREDAARLLDQARLRHETGIARLKELETAYGKLSLEKTELSEQMSALMQDGNLPDLAILRERLQNTALHVEKAMQEAGIAESTLARTVADATQANQGLSALERAAATSAARREMLFSRLKVQEKLVARLSEEHATAEAEQTQRPDPIILAHAVKDAAEHAAAIRQELDVQQKQASNLTMAEVRLGEQINALRERLTGLRQQYAGTQASCTDLRQRLETLNDTLAKATDTPESLQQLLSRQEAALAETRTAHEEARARDDATGQANTDAQTRRREAETTLSVARENTARLSERVQQAITARDRLLNEGTPPEGVERPTDLSEQAEASLRRQIARMSRDRDSLGAVNLRAEIEYREARETADTIAREHSELTAAIARLRDGIGSINKEGRERLGAVFAEVDRHFQSLFARMFGGGRAHLGLVGGEDPLEAGLEIFAQPPGKKLSTLSLLSGGEQALTALSLIFATFRCNPAPICVLDEVDAPLDDANVERFCSLLADMTKEAGTRFLVVTHHQLTMAHMDRLFGVTMQERGVSRILSVDLGRAVQMVGG